MRFDMDNFKVENVLFPAPNVQQTKNLFDLEQMN